MRLRSAAAGLAAAALAAPAALRLGDALADRRAAAALAGPPPAPAPSPEAMARLPPAARRYFAALRPPGARPSRVSLIVMGGTLDLGSRAAPAPRPMRARQILAPPRGFVWRVRAGAVSGTDAMLGDRSWSRFRLGGLMPVARASGPNHLRSSFGRMAGEAAFWCPGALLPGPGILWEGDGPRRARVTLSRGGLSQAVDVALGPDGLPERVEFLRWSDANPERAYRLQPFGGHLSDFATFGGWRLPRRVTGGNMIGTPDWHPFFEARVRRIEVS